MEDFKKPAYPESCTADGYKATVDTGFTKLEKAALEIAAALISVPDSWDCLRATKKEKGGWMFSDELIAKTAVRTAKRILQECQKEQKEEE